MISYDLLETKKKHDYIIYRSPTIPSVLDNNLDNTQRWFCLKVNGRIPESRPETLRCVLGQDTSLLQCLSPPRCINRYRPT